MSTLFVIFIICIVMFMMFDFAGFLLTVLIIVLVVSCGIGTEMDQIEKELTEYVEKNKEKLDNANVTAVEEIDTSRLEVLKEITEMCNDSREIEYEADGKIINIGCGMPYIRDKL